MVHIVSGLEDGDRVLLTPPLEQAEVENSEPAPETPPAAGETPVSRPEPRADAGETRGGRAGGRNRPKNSGNDSGR